MTNNTRISLVIFGMVNAVLFGMGTIPLLTITALQEQWKFLLPIWVVTSSLLAWPVSRRIAPRLTARYWRERKDD